jgi:chemotaxis protein methyltransferase WspC
MTPLEHIGEWLARHAGFDTASVGPGHLKAAVQRRLRHLALDSEAAYAGFLEKHPEEGDELVEATMVRETRFFRDAAVFEAAGQWAADWSRSHPGQTLRVLSLPCASGEEAWSLAACLTAHGLHPDRLRIEARDISAEAITAAREGLYQASSFRGVSHADRARFARETPEGWRILDPLRPLVTFQRRNILEDSGDAESSSYHLIFCRNLLIYLVHSARLRVVGTLHRLLKPEGRLVIGSGDLLPELLERFAPVRPASSFALTPHRPLDLAAVETAARAAAVPARPAAPPAEETSGEETPEAQYYERARVFLQNGDERHAERSCRQALYVNPVHVPSLELLSELWSHRAPQRLRRALHGRLHRARRGGAA